MTGSRLNKRAAFVRKVAVRNDVSIIGVCVNCKPRGPVITTCEPHGGGGGVGAVGVEAC